ncbi:hypothetical protein QKU48_gp0486 [Fadolivirus algeromassiliense]|jgi:hypothetical protein|uniref:Uncharacterized protein n=1 Tax=Fadolivirus FV1/VV64 TaxID=3070911 RepID=A0A7D3QV31_9VIRU|nr:hypothetical protein QKU48_gp0486 [Fadolivirus algeromassiliense]QKF93944.1 hypothetical protein Fadolivirus_1_486 [Fadolivirus FV1/VV64]
MNHNKESTLKHKYIKFWLFAVLLISCIFICIQIYINNNSHYIPKENIIDYKILSSLTPKYPNFPPPLYNFMD